MDLVKLRRQVEDLIDSKSDSDLYNCPMHFPELAPFVVVALVVGTPLNKVSEKVLSLIDFEIEDQNRFNQKTKKWFQWKK